ncbi:MAG: hypothetical protein RLY70_3288 [Planctomycetota bacterium]
MSAPRLRVFYGPEQETQVRVLPETLPMRPNVTLPVGDVLPILADALLARRAWLQDFEDDEITISSDLYEVMLAYQHFRRPSA